MTLKNIIECDCCGEREITAKESEYLTYEIQCSNVISNRYHLCPKCKPPESKDSLTTNYPEILADLLLNCFPLPVEEEIPPTLPPPEERGGVPKPV